MLSQRRINMLFAAAAEAAGRFQWQLTIRYELVRTTRFAVGRILPSGAPEGTTIEVKVIAKCCLGTVTTDVISCAGVRDAVLRALALARSQTAGTAFLPFPGPGRSGPQSDRSHCDDRLVAMTGQEQVELVSQMLEVAVGKKAHRRPLKASGVHSVKHIVSVIGNSRGLCSRQEHTLVDCNCTMHTKADTNGWERAVSWSLDHVDHMRIARSARRKAILGGEPRHFSLKRARRSVVILSASAVADLLFYLSDHFSAAGHYDGQSCFAGRVGYQLLGTNVTISDDASHELQCGPLCDSAGIHRQRVTLVEGGVIQIPVVGRGFAKFFGWRATGHDSGPGPQDYELVENLVLAGGNKSLDQMVKDTADGFLIAGFGYTNVVDNAGIAVTGDTRKGLYRIRNGKLVARAQDFRFVVNVAGLLTRVIELGIPVAAVGEDDLVHFVVPPIKVKGFPFRSPSYDLPKNRSKARRKTGRSTR